MTPMRICMVHVIAVVAPLATHASRMVVVPGGFFAPFVKTYSPKAGKRIAAKLQRVRTFKLDRYPVTNRNFASFVAEHEEWSKTGIKPVFAEGEYLRHWSGSSPPSTQAEEPVVNISWFAADAYCRAQGKRLPTTLEWEYAAAGGKRTAADLEKIRRWYATPSVKGPAKVGLGAANGYGIHDMHGLIWEWVSDFNAKAVDADSRGGNDAQGSLFCGGSAAQGSDFKNYAAYMRFAFRSSLKGTYTISNLGFRCAADGAGEAR